MSWPVHQPCMPAMEKTDSLSLCPGVVHPHLDKSEHLVLKSHAHVHVHTDVHNVYVTRDIIYGG